MGPADGTRRIEREGRAGLPAKRQTARSHGVPVSLPPRG